jgi:hypothetical protein
MRPRFDSPADARAIRALEVADGLPCPPALRRLLQECAAIVAMDVGNGYWVGGPIELERSIRRGDFPKHVSCNGRNERVIPVATDGGGNAFFLCHDVDGVWRWDHETGAESFVAEDLCRFLHRIAEDWEHEAEGDRSWRYLV